MIENESSDELKRDPDDIATASGSSIGEPKVPPSNDEMSETLLVHRSPFSVVDIDRPDDDLADSVSGGKGPKILVGVLDPYVEKIKDRLGSYLESPEGLQDFQPMVEWDLATQGKLSEIDILQAYTTATQLSVVDEEEFENINRFEGVTFDYLNQWNCLPVSWDSESVVLAVATPYSIATIAHHWHHLLGRSAHFCLGQRSHIERSINSIYGALADELGVEDLGWDGDASEAALRDLALEAPIVRLVNDMFAQAIEMGASDIHVEPSESHLAIRFRIDGVLQLGLTPPITSYAAIASRIKLIGGLNIAERRLPQDGRTDLQIGRAQIDIRISTLPSMHGESVVLRLLRKDIASFTLENIGMPADLKDPFTRMVRRPHGMILVVGPTGSGKTTTLYCVMNLLDSAEKKIITIEDPIEYQMNGVTQIQVKPAIGMSFANGLRSIVRQDPDIILVGEIRDKETAEIAIHAALTGHLVLSTLHTNDATGAISRLVDMGVEPFLISSALVGVLSQRLVRQICGDCGGTGVGVPVSGKGSPAKKTDIPEANGNEKACRKCHGTGYRGRLGIFEFLTVDEEIRRATGEGADNVRLSEIAKKNGMRSLTEDGHTKVRNGITTEAEIKRVCQFNF